MGRQLRIEYPGAYYHVTARGNERKDIFKSNRDREKFLEYLQSSVERYGAIIHVWCLMDNHYHLLLETPQGNLSQIMQHVNGAYTNYFNTKRKRSGHLFQGRYKAILVEADEYAVELSRYIHLNPVRIGAVADPVSYRWSSCADYADFRKPPNWLKRDFILGFFGTAECNAIPKYRIFINDLLGKEAENPLVQAVVGTILGTPEFVERIREEYEERMLQDRNLPVPPRTTPKVDLERIVASAQAAFGERKRQAEKVAIHLAHRYSGLKLREIGSRFGLKDSGVSEVSRRVSKELAKDEIFQQAVEKLRKELVM
jgi:putative transposase